MVRKKSENQCELTSISGVGDLTLQKLKDAGISSVKALAIAPLSKLMYDTPLGEKTSKKIIKEAQNMLNLGFKSGWTILMERKYLRKLTSGNQILDDILGGGFEPGTLTEVFGKFETGKTQLAHQLSVNIQLTYEEGGLEGNSLYIDADGSFRPERIVQMTKARSLNPEEVLNNITVGRAYNADFQISLINKAGPIIKKKNVKFLVVDTLTNHFQNEYPERVLSSKGYRLNTEGQYLLNSHIHDLLRLTVIFPELVVVVTNQIKERPDMFYGNPIEHIGGYVVAHNSIIRIYLRSGNHGKKIATVVEAPHLPIDEAFFSITGGGIGD